MGILEQFDVPCFRPSKSDRQLLIYMKENASSVSYMPIAKLAAGAGVGESTITRFVKKMGYSSLQSFKVELAEEIAEGSRRYIINSSIQNEESALVTGRKLLDVNIGTLEKTLESLRAGVIETCADMLFRAGRIFFVGLGNSGFIAQDTAYKFFRIGVESHGIDNSHHMMIIASLAREGDVIVAISHAGNSREVLQTAELAKKNGAAVIAITANKKAALCRAADIYVTYEAQESLLETGSISAKLAQFFIMDLIYTQVVKSMADAAAENKQKTTKAMAMLHR